MQSGRADKTIDHSSTRLKVTSAHPGVMQQLEIAGFMQFFRLGYIQLDHALITALVDRWRPETSSFHLRVGEMTITLADVAVLLGLPVDGLPVRLPTEQHDYIAMCDTLLGISPPPEVRWGNETVLLGWFREALAHDIPADATDVQIAQRTRAIILHLINCRLLVDHSMTRLSLRYLPFLEDLAAVRTYSWGSAVLSYLYKELHGITTMSRGSIGGRLALIHVLFNITIEYFIVSNI